MTIPAYKNYTEKQNLTFKGAKTMKRQNNRIMFTEQNVKEIKSDGEKTDLYYDKGCNGLLICVTPVRQEPMYCVSVSYQGGATRKNIGSVGRVDLELARKIATNVRENKKEFLKSKTRTNECLVDDFEKNGFYPRVKKENIVAKQDYEIENLKDKIKSARAKIAWVSSYLNAIYDELGA